MPIKKTAIRIGLILIVASAGFALAFRHRHSPATYGEKASSAISAMHETKPAIPQGKHDYRVQQDANAKPHITEVSIDPPDVRPGYKQTLSITIESQSKNMTVTAETKTDNRTVSIALDPVKEEGDLKTFAKTWTVEDTHDATYHTKFIASDGEHKNEITLAWTDPCGIPNGGDWTMTSDCTISNLDGVDNGNATIQSGTLTLNAPFVFNSGKSLWVSGGTVLIGSGASIQKDSLYAIDADGDGYPASSGFSTSSASGVRRYTLSGNGSLDCYDSNANAHPGQTSYFAANRGDGSFDYDCNGQEDQEWGSDIGINQCIQVSPGIYGCQQPGWNASAAACGQSKTYIYADCISPEGNRCNSGILQATCR